MAAQLDTSFGGHTEYCFPHYEVNLNKGREVSIPKGIHSNYTVKDKTQPASTQAIRPMVSKAVPVILVPQRDPAIDGGIPDIYTAEEVRKFRESGHTDDQIKRLGRRKLARKANRAKKREGEDV
uniref:Uncharacterized protein n=1 Tax=Romanomermis culicivorax TaxID=13658 RepID=A0A915KJV7_ROMCU